ncbi:MAG: hypothetical protein L0J69_01350, partial [Yaniella sp.]|nr:hypothetical protein [Yaniella sp.]
MTLSPMISPKPAQYPHSVLDPLQLPGWDPRWSQIVEAETCDGTRQFHVLDTGPMLADRGIGPDDIDAIVIAVHGNPTWSYLWRHIAQAGLEAAQGNVELGPGAGRAP